MVYLIKDLSRKTGFSIYTLKYYLKLGLVQESGRSPETRFRYFDEQTVDALTRIRELRRAGRSLAEIRRLLQGECVTHAKHQTPNAAP